MDIEKLTEKANHLGMELKRDGGEFEYSIGKKFLEYATALSALHAENEKLRDELEQVKAGRDAAIEYLREIEWCAGCKHFGGLDGCKKWAMGQCTEKHDLYEFIGPQKED